MDSNQALIHLIKMFLLDKVIGDFIYSTTLWENSKHKVVMLSCFDFWYDDKNYLSEIKAITKFVKAFDPSIDRLIICREDQVTLECFAKGRGHQVRKINVKGKDFVPVK